MIGESSGITTLLNNERIYRQSQAESVTPGESEEQTSTSGVVTDEVTFSAEAVALRQQVASTSETPEENVVEPQGREQEEPAPPPDRNVLDIRV